MPFLQRTAQRPWATQLSSIPSSPIRRWMGRVRALSEHGGLFGRSERRVPGHAWCREGIETVRGLSPASCSYRVPAPRRPPPPPPPDPARAVKHPLGLKTCGPLCAASSPSTSARTSSRLWTRTRIRSAPAGRSATAWWRCRGSVRQRSGRPCSPQACGWRWRASSAVTR